MIMHRYQERSVKALPVWIPILLTVAMTAQIIWHMHRPDPIAHFHRLTPPPVQSVLEMMSLGDPVAMSKILMLWLQAHDNQPGISVPFRQLDYSMLIHWLEAILKLDPRAHYPLLAASRVYGEVPDAEKQRQILAFVAREFQKDPDHRWPWMAHAVYIARHKLKDEQLALKYARLLADKARGENVPGWAKQMHIFLLEDMGEIESAKILLGALLESGQIEDPNEQAFLYQRLAELEGKRGQTGRQ